MKLISSAISVKNYAGYIKSYIADAEKRYDALINMKGDNNLLILNVSDRPKVKCIVDVLKSIIND